MTEMNDRDYYVGRAEASRRLAARAVDPAIAAIHLDFARRYEATLIKASQSARYDSSRIDQTA